MFCLLMLIQILFAIVDFLANIACVSNGAGMRYCMPASCRFGRKRLIADITFVRLGRCLVVLFPFCVAIGAFFAIDIGSGTAIGQLR